MKKRFFELCEKLLSFKFVIFVIATVLRIFHVIGNAEWLTIATIVIAGHEGQKGFSKYLERNTNEESLGSD